METLDDDILRKLETYYENYKEHQAILNTLRLQRKQYQQAIKRVTKNMEDCSESIMKYLEKYNHPGIKYNECYFIPQEKRKRLINQEKKFEEILNSHGIHQDTKLYSDLQRSLYQMDSKNKKLVVKRNIKKK
ncbi:MAG: hypothetical protein CMM15_10860 [Rhodospirillaceae bacterium]|nr:hypothetical protein [Rhodospirillaceae bacterium]OUX67854.1 MAG: hypothetical protein CBD38_01115 [bacterium TMED178]